MCYLLDSTEKAAQTKIICWDRRAIPDATIQRINIYIIDTLLYTPCSFSTAKLPIIRIYISRLFKTTMIGTSTAEYFFIRICILFLHNIAPISISYCVQLLVVQFFHPATYLGRISYPIQIWLTAEAVFFSTVFIPLKYALHNSPICHTSLPGELREKLFRCCNRNVPNLEKYLSQWLMVSEAECIKRDNVKDFIRWAFFAPGPTRELDQQNEGQIETYTTELEQLMGRSLSPGRMDVKGLGQLLNEAGGSHRSLLWYTVSYLYVWWSHIILTFQFL